MPSTKHSTARRRIAALAIIPAAAGIALAAAGPAFASSTPPGPGTVTGSVVVAATITLSLDNAEITFPSVPGAGFAPGSNVDNVSVTSNEAWTLTLAAPAAFTNTAGNTIPISNFNFEYAAAGQGYGAWTVPTADTTVATGGQTGATPAVSVIAYQLQVPSGQMPGTYTAGFDYIASGA
jgi:hypothetical protein